MDAHQSDDTGSDAELLDNWDVVDTDEAADASLYFSQAEEHKMSEEQVQEEEEAPELEDFVPQVDTPDEDSLVDSENLNKGESESDDGVSVISDSGPEEEEEVVVARAESVCEEQELLELGEKGEAQYKHQPNPQLNLLLNAILVVAFASVSGLAVGHFLGVQEECFAPPVAPVAWKQFNSLNLENDLLKMQLKQLQDSLVEKQNPWNEVQAPGNIYEEQMRPLEKWSAGQEIALKSSPEERENDLLKTQLKQLQDSVNEKRSPWNEVPAPENNYEEPLKSAEKEWADEESVPKASATPPPKRPDSFFGRVEAELEAVMRRVGGQDGALRKTAGSVRRWAEQVRAQTATGSTYALEQLKKGVARAVHGLKKAAAHLNSRHRNHTQPHRPKHGPKDKWRPKQQWRGQEDKWRPKHQDDDKWRHKRLQFQQQHKNFKPQSDKWRR